MQKSTSRFWTAVLLMAFCLLKLLPNIRAILYTYAYFVTSNWEGIKHYTLPAVFLILGCTLFCIALLKNKQNWMLLGGSISLLLSLCISDLPNFRILVTLISAKRNSNFYEFLHEHYIYRLYECVVFLILLAFVALFACHIFTKNRERMAKIAQKILFVSGILQILFFAFYLYVRFFVPFLHYDYSYFDTYFYDWHLAAIISQSLLQVVIFLIVTSALGWLAYPQGRPRKLRAATDGSSPIANGTEEGYVSMTKHVLLLLFTFGIWQYIWIYRTTDYLNRVKDEEYRSPTKQLLLCLFVPFYSIFWMYRSAQRIDKLSNDKGIFSDISTLCLIMAIVFTIIAPIIMQSNINRITETPIIKEDVAEQLKKYKELLDSGVITQADFDAKKKQLLAL